MHLSFGALVKGSNDYIYPAKAEKKIKYICPHCEKDVLVRKGNIRIHHFAHCKSDSPCEYYNNPGESEIHKEAKLLLKTILNEKRKLNIQRKCVKCDDLKEVLTDFNLYTTTSNVILEFPFIFNNSQKKADVALLNDERINVIFEICYKNKTCEENRPEPWIEFKAAEFINLVNQQEKNDILNLICIRHYKCGNCILNEEYEKKKREEELEKLRKKREEQIARERKELENKLKDLEAWNLQQEEIALKREKEMIEEAKKKWELHQKNIYINDKMYCKCGLKRLNICKCSECKFFFNKDYKLYKCMRCGNWKDKCLNDEQQDKIKDVDV